MTTNITVRVDAKLARQAKIIAAQKGTSLSAMVADWLSSLPGRTSEYEKARRRDVALMEKGINMGVYGNPTWTREELHERK